MGYVATADDLVKYRTSGKWSEVYVAVYKPPVLYRARVNQIFSSVNDLTSITYDTGTGTLASVLPDMELWVGTAPDLYDKGITRIRDKDATHFYIASTSDISFADNDYLTVVPAFSVWSRPVKVLDEAGHSLLDEIAYTDQHTNFDPQPNMGADKVVELTGSSVSTSWNASTSFCPRSSISAYAWSASTASATSGMTTATPTITFNTVGWHLVYLTVTAANGKSFFGVRMVYVWNRTNMPYRAVIDSLDCSVESGGWRGQFTLRTNASLSNFYERAKVILFTKDYYGSTQANIGPVPGSENVRFVGWISGEVTQVYGPDPYVQFSVMGPAGWLMKVPSWPDGIEISMTGVSYDWTNISNITVDLAIYHQLRWRSTITRICDVTLSGDTRLAQDVTSSAQNLWAQLQEMAWTRIYARPGVNAQGQFSLQIHPSLIPSASRGSTPTVMTILKSDLRDNIAFDRVTVPPVSMVDMSGVVVTAFRTGSSLFSLAPGNSLPHYGDWDIQPNLLLSTQAQANTLAGLYRSWRNGPFKNLQFVFKAAIGYMDCFPNQRSYISLTALDNLRGWAYTGGLFPLNVSLIQEENGYLYSNVTFEAETTESASSNGITPGSIDPSQPPTPSFPPLPDIPPILPGYPPGDASRTVIFVDPNDAGHTGIGIIYTKTFDSAVPTWLTMNGGLTQPQAQAVNQLVVTPSGAVYAMFGGRWTTSADPGMFIARAPAIGELFTMIATSATIMAEYPPTGFSTYQIGCLACRPDVPDTVIYVAGKAIPPFGDTSDVGVYLGTNGTFTKTMTISNMRMTGSQCTATYGQSNWGLVYQTVTGAFQQIQYHRLNQGATAQTFASAIGGFDTIMVRGGVSGVLYVLGDAASSQFMASTNDGNTWAALPSTNDMNAGGAGFATDDFGRVCMARWNVGHKGVSYDYGSTWLALSSLPSNGGYCWGYLGGVDADSEWVAIGAGAVARYSPDAGNTWANRDLPIATMLTVVPRLVVAVRTIVP